MLKEHLKMSLERYFSHQVHIHQLCELMSEPILSLGTPQDSLDLMLEIEMYDLLKHQIVVEVMNLVNEGRYSVGGSVLHLS